MKVHKKQGIYFLAVAAGFFLCAVSVQALEVNIREGLPYVSTTHDGKAVEIRRIQDQQHMLTGGFTKTSRKCPPFCIQPTQVAPGVVTVGELEVLTFIENKLNKGKGLLIDARTPSWYKKGTIPGSINIPFTRFGNDQDEAARAAVLARLGVTRKTSPSFLENAMASLQSIMGNGVGSSEWNFSKAKEITLWCNGMWCGQSPHAIHALLDFGYPAEKIYYYRGGMQDWKILGLTVIVPADQ
ncbi:MAG: rhodanese-like domain-containing protein [Gammaproteobacteria bacterium]|nr:rhodanese-like domain-containing protein [Gammaproteobacteria bacterium]MCF6362819.1 rhodanese-like domain-containing protein [Gammaproteobacteria bacterium]